MAGRQHVAMRATPPSCSTHTQAAHWMKAGHAQPASLAFLSCPLLLLLLLLQSQRRQSISVTYTWCLTMLSMT